MYEDTFKLVRADTPELKEAAFRLRHHVYCVEQPFEDPAKNSTGMEIDEYDDHSVHTLLIHRKSGRLLGNVRIVLPDANAPLASFPMQHLTSLQQLNDEEHIRKSCEISRFCITKSARVGGNGRLPAGVFLDPSGNNSSLLSQHEQRIFPFAALGLIRAIFEMSLEHDIALGYGLLEPHFIRLLKRQGIMADILGPPVNYHGNRLPVELAPLKICHSVQQLYPELWKILTKNGALVNKIAALAKRHQTAGSLLKLAMVH